VVKVFPHSDDYRYCMYVGRDIRTVDRLLSDLIQGCAKASDFLVDEDDESFRKYIQLVNAKAVPRDPRFVSQLISDPNHANRERMISRVR
jgi:hypothetical protein